MGTSIFIFQKSKLLQKIRNAPSCHSVHMKRNLGAGQFMLHYRKGARGVIRKQTFCHAHYTI
ncbi:hypothetical protein KsCSTR_23550 [Candidatus Kuenenia stuttgartiensis]|uniref:Uncharacterized protein n=1 Tax=Kuenenia stuttgartiensis TaxID=174633 RepID=Q1Q3N3_KUEST|nr:hypothetical protein KsCSTR_23550 [Candidatus Kuenenia stuttgartiensis]CAJ74623.1 unknown protein [Candidatus Kuenenia stuttgartiensis]